MSPSPDDDHAASTDPFSNYTKHDSPARFGLTIDEGTLSGSQLVPCKTLMLHNAVVNEADLAHGDGYEKTDRSL